MALTIFRNIPAFVRKPGSSALVRYMSHKGGKMNPELAFQKEKEKYLNMSEDERCERFQGYLVTVSQIESWNKYYTNNKDRLQNLDKSVYCAQFSIMPYETKPALNELVSIWSGNITKLAVDAIVNAANNSLLGGLGVDGAIHKAAGNFLYDECKTLLGCETGDAKITGGYKLPAKYVIHTVGPKQEKPELLESCYNSCLKQLREHNLRTIAFPCISTGLYGYPQDSAATIALKTVRKFLEENSSSVDRVIFCLFLDEDVKIYETMMQLFFPAQ